MDGSPLGVNCADIVINSMEMTSEGMSISGHTVVQEVPCPCCAHPSSRVQSKYVRTLVDLPISGQRVRLIIHARRFWCTNTACPRKIFVERLPVLAIAHARKTTRLKEMLQAIGLELGGEAASRLGKQLHMESSPDTFLRFVRQSTTEISSTPRVVGIDDWSYRRGHTYGTILCDLERHTVIDLLPDRSADSVAIWLQHHPNVEVVSRDRAQVYADGATRGAPNAQQVADRWHLLKNLSEALELQLVRSRHEKKQEVTQALIEELPAKPVAEKPKEPLPSAEDIRPRPHWQDEEAQQLRREERLNRYTQIETLDKQGVKHKDIAKMIGVGERTVTRYLSREAFPERNQRCKQPHSLDPYVPYLVKRWEEGCHNGRQLWREICVQGFTGAASLIYGYIERFRQYDGLPSSKHERASGRAKIPSVCTTKKAAWFFLRRSSDLSEEERTMLETYLKDHENVVEVYDFAQTFATMLREQQADQLETWLQQVEASSYINLHRFAAGIRKDHAAVLAAFTSPWSQGQVEGQVNRLKMIKRQMYGRANFDLLRHRVLHRVEGRA